MGPTFGRQDVGLGKDGLRRKNQHQKDDVAGEDDYQSHARQLCESCQQNDERGVGHNRRQVVDIGQWLRRFRSSIYPKRFDRGNRLQHTWTNSSGEGGTGWLELGWNNFLGGPWHNQKVRDGSWTLMRVEGKWCFGGSRTRIRTVTHNARGELSMVMEDGTPESGHLQGPWLFLEADGMTTKGTMDFRANRVDWSSGFYWTWCGRN